MVNLTTIQEVIKYIAQNKEELGIALFAPATDSEIKQFEKKLKIKLPDDIKEFYQWCNGFESAEDIFRIVPLDEALRYSGELNKHEFYIAEYMIYSDMWAVNIDPIDNSYNIMEYSFKTVLTNSYVDFLNCFLTGGVFEKDGLYDWKDKIVNGSSTDL